MRSRGRAGCLSGGSCVISRDTSLLSLFLLAPIALASQFHQARMAVFLLLFLYIPAFLSFPFFIYLLSIYLLKVLVHDTCPRCLVFVDNGHLLNNQCFTPIHRIVESYFTEPLSSTLVLRERPVLPGTPARPPSSAATAGTVHTVAIRELASAAFFLPLQSPYGLAHMRPTKLARLCILSLFLWRRHVATRQWMPVSVSTVVVSCGLHRGTGVAPALQNTMQILHPS